MGAERRKCQLTGARQGHHTCHPYQNSDAFGQSRRVLCGAAEAHGPGGFRSPAAIFGAEPDRRVCGDTTILELDLEALAG